MKAIKSLRHTVWDCKYHVIWIPQYRRKILYGQLRRDLAPVMKELVRQRECEVLEGELAMDHVHIWF